MRNYLAALVFLVGCTGTPAAQVEDDDVTAPPEETTPANNKPPTAALTRTGNTTAGGVMVFDASGSSDPEGLPLTYHWSFGDGGRGGGRQLAHIFSSAASVTVTLTVVDSFGASATATETITITEGAAAVSTAQVRFTVRSGTTPIAGATLTALGSTATATTDAEGRATIAVGTGVRRVVRVEAAGYARQTRSFTLLANATVGVADVQMQPFDAALTLSDAAAGGTLTGLQGVRLEVPAGGLVDDTGAAVNGAVTVQVAPVDVVNNTFAFPGGFDGVGQDGTPGMIVSFGTVDYAFSQDGKHLNVAPGKLVTIEVPVYAGLRKDGTPSQVGDVHALWALDEVSGQWIQEGTGVLVQSADAPTGFALRAQVAHFSWWNCDDFTEDEEKETQCCLDTDEDGDCDLDVDCDLYAGTCGVDNCTAGLAGANAGSGASRDAVTSPPVYTASTTIMAGAPQRLRFPTNMYIGMWGYSLDGLNHGTLIVPAGAGSSAQLIMTAIEEVEEEQLVTLPMDTTYLTGANGVDTRFVFDAAVDDVIILEAERVGLTELGGSIHLEDAAGNIVGAGQFGDTNLIAYKHITAAGRYKAVVTPSIGAPAGVRVQLRNLPGTPFPLSVTPTGFVSGATGSTFLVTFSEPIKNTSITSKLRIAAPWRDTYNDDAFVAMSAPGVSGSTATMTTNAALYPGIEYQLRVLPGVMSQANIPSVSTLTASLRTAEVPNTISYFGPSEAANRHVTMTADGSIFAAMSNYTLMELGRYEPGVGWRHPQPMTPAGAQAGSVGSPRITSAPDGRMAYFWLQVNISPHKLWARFFTPGVGWSVAEEVPVGTSPSGIYYLPVMDPSGRVLVVWAYSTGQGSNDPLYGTHWYNVRSAAGVWGTARRITGAAGTQMSQLDVNAAGNGVFVFRESYNFAMCRYDAVTETFATKENIGADDGTDADANIDDDGNIFVMTDESFTNVTMRYAVAGEPLQGPIAISGATSYNNSEPALAANGNGEVAILYRGNDANWHTLRWNGQGGDDFDISLFDARETMGPITGAAYQPAIGMSNDGKIVTLFASATEGWASRRYQNGAWQPLQSVITLPTGYRRRLLVHDSGRAHAIMFGGAVLLP